MSKISGFWIFFYVIGTALIFLNFNIGTSSSVPVPGMVFGHYGDSMAVEATSRKLKVKGFNPNTVKKIDAGKVHVEDYLPIDPVPSSKASIKPGPIQHGTPLMPFIPKPSPPRHPKCGGCS